MEIVEELEQLLAEYREEQRESITYADLVALVMKHKQAEQVQA